jgi:glycosyltransferase involved in cell wall biosynthesis
VAKRKRSAGRIAFGPEMPGWGSWEWVGADLARTLGARATTFTAWQEPDADAVIVVKHPPPPEWAKCVARRAALIYCPVDQYDSAGEIAADALMLRLCRHIIIHCERLRPYFDSFAPVTYLDHHVKYAARPRRAFRAEGRLLWVGVRTNLGPFVEWVNAHPLPAPLEVLTNLERPNESADSAALGFRAGLDVRVQNWTPELHLQLTATARASLDVKGEDFRSRHKPAAKAVDFVASGLPVAMNPRSSPAEYLAGHELEVPSPQDVDRWLSREYWEQTREVGRRLRRELTVPRVAARLVKIVEETLASPNATPVPTSRATPVHAKRASSNPKLYGLMITKDDHEVFGDWCRDQLSLYDAVVCLDGSESGETARIARDFANKLIYLDERDFEIPHKTDHGLRRVAHQEIIHRFGHGYWVMCCHADEFCYHDPRKAARRAAHEGHDLVSWFSPHFFPHPSELADWPRRRALPVPERFRHFHWSYFGNGLPWVEDRLYLARPDVEWDNKTHGTVRPHGIKSEAPFHPTLRHFKVIAADPGLFEREESCAHYKHHWQEVEHRTGLPFPVRSIEDLFVASVPKYAQCDRFDGMFPQAWNLGEEYRPDGVADEPAVVQRRAAELAVAGDRVAASGLLAALDRPAIEPRLQALVENDIAALAAADGKLDFARAGFQAALGLDPECAAARSNLAHLGLPKPAAAPDPPRVKVAIVSFLFNWPSTGGGIVHTVELARFLGEAGFDVRHFHVRHEPWGIGAVSEPLPFTSVALEFAEADWNAATIQRRVRDAVASFDPGHVILTDSWNFKPLLAEAVRDFPFILRLQALECLCPLNNVRLLPEPGGRARQCPLHQLAAPQQCAQCVTERGHFSGPLHQAERALSGVGTPAYQEKLLWAFAQSEAVLVVNPLTEAMVSPYARDVRVVTAGMDPSRFPWPPPTRPDANGPKRILFAGLTGEWMKGFHVLREACARLWSKRRDFELVATSEAEEGAESFVRHVGWQSQSELPKLLWNCDVLAMPTVAQEALGRTAVEAMAAGLPVVASRLGGLPFTVADGATGFLAAPGDPTDLAEKLETLLNDPALRKRMGEAGRRRFEEHYSWPVIIDRHYRPLLAARSRV